MKSSTMRNKWVATCLAIGAAWLVWGIGTAAAAMFNAQMLRGTYVYAASGALGSADLTLGVWLAQNGVFTLTPTKGSKTSGAVTGSLNSGSTQFSTLCSGTIDGTYQVNADGSGTITFNFKANPNISGCVDVSNVTQSFVAVNRNLINLIQEPQLNISDNMYAVLGGTLQRQE